MQVRGGDLGVNSEAITAQLQAAADLTTAARQYKFVIQPDLATCGDTRLGVCTHQPAGQCDQVHRFEVCRAH